MRELFQFAHPYEVVFATQKYCSDFYGSNLYDLHSNTSKMLFSSWRTNVKLSWNLPRNCNNIFIESLAPNVVPPNIGLLTRFHKFFFSLLESPSNEVQMMVRLSARDLRTNLGRNLEYIREETGLDPWLYGTARIKTELLNFHKLHIPDNEAWKLGYLEKLMNTRSFAYYCGNFQEEEDTNSLIHSLVTSWNDTNFIAIFLFFIIIHSESKYYFFWLRFVK